LKQEKLKTLIHSTQPGQVLFRSELLKKGYTAGDLQNYRKSGWLNALGSGVLVRAGAEPSLSAAIYALQEQRGGSSFHLGAECALYLHGFAQYLSWERMPYQLFVPADRDPPKWLLRHAWERPFSWHRYAFLPPGVALKSMDIEGYALNIARPERAILESLRRVPFDFSPQEAAGLMDNLPGLLPDVLQSLLECSTSVKTNRLLLYLADRAGHAWFKHLHIRRIKLGKGVRALVKGGRYVSKYDLMVPEEIYTDV
jgi:hypothetical protein